MQLSTHTHNSHFGNTVQHCAHQVFTWDHYFAFFLLLPTSPCPPLPSSLPPHLPCQIVEMHVSLLPDQDQPMAYRQWMRILPHSDCIIAKWMCTSFNHGLGYYLSFFYIRMPSTSKCVHKGTVLSEPTPYSHVHVLTWLHVHMHAHTHTHTHTCTHTHAHTHMHTHRAALMAVRQSHSNIKWVQGWLASYLEEHSKSVALWKMWVHHHVPLAPATPLTLPHWVGGMPMPCHCTQSWHTIGLFFVLVWCTVIIHVATSPFDFSFLP